MPDSHNIESVTEDVAILPNGSTGKVRVLHVVSRKGSRFTVDVPVETFNLASARDAALKLAEEVDSAIGPIEG